MAPKHLHLLGTKGGCGRSTTTLNLAGALSARGYCVIVVDLDANGRDGGCLRWAAQARAAGRNPAFFVVPALPRRLESIDIVLWDHPPGAPRLPEGHVIVPSPVDAGSFFSAMATMRLMKNRKPAPILVATRVRTDRADVRRLLAKMPGVAVVRDRAIYPNAFGRGQTIYDPGLHHSASARAEFDVLVDKVESGLGMTREAA